MSHRIRLPAVNCPFISQLVALMNAKLLSSRTLPAVVTGVVAPGGRSGYQVSVNWAVRNVCCFDIQGIYVGRSPAIIQRVNSVHSPPLTATLDGTATLIFG